MKIALLAACAAILLRLRPACATAPKRIESRFHLLIREAAPQAEIPGEDGKDEQAYRFQVFDDRRGYARLVGPFEGYQDFFLIRGKGRDHLISVEYACRPACSQRVTIQRFDAGAAPATLPLMDVLALSEFDSIRRRLMSLCLDSDGNFDTQADDRDKAHRALPACPFVFSFPKTRSAAVTLFKVVNDGGGDLLLSVGKTNVVPKLRFGWDGRALVGEEPAGDEAIFLNDEKMRELF